MTNVFFPTIPTARVTQVFNNYNPLLYGGDRRHKGIDYGIAPNTDVYSCMDGIVELATTAQTGYGRHLRILHHDGSLSIYGHMNVLLVDKGQVVKAGELIGKSGGDPNDSVDGDGLSTGAHLHWEIRPPGLHASDQSAVDPMKYCIQYLDDVEREVAEITATGLNVRVRPHVLAPQIGLLYRKEIIHVVETYENWARVHSLRPEWSHVAYMRFTGEVIKPVPIEEQPELTLEEKVYRLWSAHPELHEVKYE